MGSFRWLNRNFSPPPIAIHFGSDVVRMMQIRDAKKQALQGVCEVAKEDFGGIAEAISTFRGKRCVVSLPSSDVLVQHIRVPLEADGQVIRERLVQHDTKWGNSEIRQACVTTTGGSGSSKQEILCVGVDRDISEQVVTNLENAGAEVEAITVPLYASIRAFDQLYRRDGDDKITSMLIDFDADYSMVMIAHGSNCVFAHQLSAANDDSPTDTWEPSPPLLPVHESTQGEFERRNDQEPRGLYGVQETTHTVDSQCALQLQRCLRHHDALFPNRSVERVIFTGCGANDTDRCSAIASELGISGFVADPSAWISGAADLASGPAWTTVAGLCMRYAEKVA